jgi:hypothetical protein
MLHQLTSLVVRWQVTMTTLNEVFRSEDTGRAGLNFLWWHECELESRLVVDQPLITASLE